MAHRRIDQKICSDETQLEHPPIGGFESGIRNPPANATGIGWAAGNGI